MTLIDTHVSAVRSRLATTLFIRGFGVGLMGIGTGAVAAVLASKLVAWQVPGGLYTAGGAALLAAVGATAYAMSRRPSHLDTAVEIDKALDLKERLSTALAVRKQAHEDPFLKATVDDAERIALGLKPSQHFPIRWHWSLPTALGLGLVALTLYATLGQYDLLGKKAEEVAQVAKTQKQEQAKAAVQKALAELQQATPVVKGDASVERAQKELQDLLARPIADPAAANRSALSALQDLQKAVQAKVQTSVAFQQAEQDKRAFSNLMPDPSDKTTIADAQRAIAQGDFNQAMKDIEKAVKEFDKLDAEDQKKSADQMKKMAEQLKQMAQDPNQQKKLEEQLKKEMQKQGMDEQQAQQMAQNLAKQMQQASSGSPQQQQQAMQQMAQQAQQAMQQMNNGQGPSPQQQQAMQQALQQAMSQANTQQNANQLSQAAQQLAQAMQQATQQQMGQQQGQQAQQNQQANGQNQQANGQQQQPGQQGQSQKGQQQGQQNQSSQANSGQQGQQNSPGQQPGQSGQGSGESMQQAMQNMQDQLGQMQSLQDEANQMADAMNSANSAANQQAGNCNGNGNGQNPGNGDGNGQWKPGEGERKGGNGDGMQGGNAQASGDRSAKEQAPYSVKQERAPVQNIKEGKLLASTLVKAGIEKGEAREQLKEVARAAEQEAAEEVDTERVSRSAQKAVKDYFNSFGGNAGGPPAPATQPSK